MIFKIIFIFCSLTHNKRKNLTRQKRIHNCKLWRKYLWKFLAMQHQSLTEFNKRNLFMIVAKLWTVIMNREVSSYINPNLLRVLLSYHLLHTCVSFFDWETFLKNLWKTHFMGVFNYLFYFMFLMYNCLSDPSLADIFSDSFGIIWSISHCKAHKKFLKLVFFSNFRYSTIAWEIQFPLYTHRPHGLRDNRKKLTYFSKIAFDLLFQFPTKCILNWTKFLFFFNFWKFQNWKMKHKVKKKTFY